MADLSYIFEGGKVFAIREGKVIASAASLPELERLAWNSPGNPGDNHHEMQHELGTGDESPCEMCGGQVDFDGRCSQCGHSTIHGDPFDEGLSNGPFEVPHSGESPFGPNHNVYGNVVGPGGITGTILAKTRDLWGDEVSVRFANGRIAHLRVVPDGTLQGGFKQSTEKVASTRLSATEELQAQLDADFDGGRDGILSRLAVISSIRDEGRRIIGSLTAADAAILDGILVTAEVERGTLNEALESIAADDAASQEFAPYDVQAAPAQASLGHGGEWLDSVVSGMIAEAESQDFETLVREGSLLFVSDLSSGAIADTGVTRDMATRYIRSKTAGIAPTVAQEIERDFLAAAESARRTVLASAAQEPVVKQASADPYADLPDDILFA